MKCPFCGCEKFIRTMEEIVTITDTGDGLLDNVKDCISIIYKCFNCGRIVTEEKLVK